MNKTSKIIVGAIIAIFVVGVIWYGFSQKQTPAREKNTSSIKIGVSAALTGESASWGQNGLAGIELAAKEINDNGGIYGRKIELIIEDDKASPQESANVVNKLINIDKVVALIMSNGSGATSAAAPIAQKNGIPTMVTIATNPSITKIGDYIFRVMPSDSSQGKFAADFVSERLNKKTLAILYVNNAWGKGLTDEFKKEFLAVGGKVAYEGSVLETDKDLKVELLKVKNSGAEVLYFPVYPTNALIGFKQIKELGINLPVICGDSIDGNEILQNSASEGIMYTLSKINSPKEFVEKINSLKGFENLTTNIGAATSYDGAKILFMAIGKTGIDGTTIKNELSKTHYSGVSNPTIEFNDNREVNNPTFEVKIVKDRQAVTYTEK